MPKIKLNTKLSFHLELVTPNREEVSQLIKMIMLEFLPIIILFTAYGGSFIMLRAPYDTC